MKIAIASGYFNPIHVGHLDYLNKAKELADVLVVIVNNDNQRELKGSAPFHTQVERLEILRNIKCVDKVYLSIDTDRTVCETLRWIHHDVFKKNDELMFVNGGDQFNDFIPEWSVCKELGIKLIDGLGQKRQSSSWLLNLKQVK